MKMLGTLVHWCESQVKIVYWIWFYFCAVFYEPDTQPFIGARKLAEVAGHGDSKCVGTWDFFRQLRTFRSV